MSCLQHRFTFKTFLQVLSSNSSPLLPITVDTVAHAVHPLFLKAKPEASKDNDPNWHQAMNEPFTDEYLKATKKEIDTIEGMGAQDIVGLSEDDMNINNGTWASSASNYQMVL